MRKEVITYVKSALRRTWGRSKQRTAALHAAKIAYGKYRCAECQGIFRRKEIECDHKKAIGKFVSFDIFIERLFCDSKELQILCRDCHKNKTKKDKKKMK